MVMITETFLEDAIYIIGNVNVNEFEVHDAMSMVLMWNPVRGMSI